MRNTFLKLLGAALALSVAIPAQAHFQDNFDRADNAVIGNGWIEKSAAAFTLAGNRAVKASVATGYRDNLVYRPSTEDVLDVEASAEFTLTNANNSYPQIAVRAQSATIANIDTLDSYLLYVNTANDAQLGRQTGNAFVTTLATLTLSAPLNTTSQYRLRLSARGTNPVLLSAWVERLDSGVWTTIGFATFSDTAANRIATAGTVAIGGYVEGTYSYDNFTRIDLGAVGTANPVPTVSSSSPNQATAGESGFTVFVYGTGFTTDSVGRVDGSARTTTYNSPTEVAVQLLTSDLGASGTRNLSVANPAPGGGISGVTPFVVVAPGAQPPTITSLNPTSATAGGSAFTLTVSGTGFNSGSTVRWNGAARTTTFMSATQLTAAISATDIASAGTAAITVLRNSDSTTSNSVNFTIAAPPVGDFVDTFTRADSAAIGNGWLEKTAASFDLVSNEAAKVGAGNDYRNNLVYRPVGEDIADVEAAMEFRLLSTPVGYPQLFVRGQSASIATTGSMTAYLLYFNNSTTQAVLSRQVGTSFDTPLTTLTLGTALNTTDRFRMRLSAVGTNPVNLTATIERWNGTSWSSIGSATFADSNAARITAAGTVGFGGYVETNYRYDNFTRTALGVTNPTPTLTSIAPTSATAGAAAFTLTVNGTGFVSGSVVRWNGAARTTTFVSSSQLTAAISAADVASAGSAPVTVFNPAPGGGTSTSATFTINPVVPNPAPTLASISPASANAGSLAFALTVNGSNFIPGSVVRWNGTDRTTAFVSATQLSAAISAADVTTAGTASVTVFNPAPGGGTSGAATFTINAVSNPSPTLSSMSPTTTTAGSAAFTLTVNGSNFVGSSVVRWNGASRTTTVVSANQLTAAITATDVASVGTATVTVFTPTPGGGTSSGLTFSISAANNPVPVASTLSPAAVTAGTGAFTLTVTGSNFVNGAIVRWNGANRTTTFVNATQLTASITATDVASAGTAAVSVFNPTPGGGTSGNLTFTINGAVNPVPVLTSVSPISAVAASGSVTVTINGSNFRASSVVRYNGQSRTTTYVSPTQLQAVLTAADTQTIGNGAITVYSPPAGGGQTDPQTFFVLAAGQTVVYDNFNRADSATIGNNWTEKQATAFSITNNEVTGIPTAYDFHDALVYRPAGEDRADVETSFEFRRLAVETTNDGFPQLHSRVQRNTITQAGTLQDYIFYVEDFEPSPGSAMIAIQAPNPNEYECWVKRIDFPTPLVVGDRYRLRFRVQGTSPVVLTGIVERWNGNSWDMFASGSYAHSTTSVRDPSLYCFQGTLPQPITTAGATGFAKWTTQPDVYDNYYAIDLTGQPIAPVIASVTPNPVSAGGGAFTLTVNGAQFNSGSVVRWNGSNRPTTFISATQLQASITATDIATAGTAQITVLNSTNTGGTSLSFALPVTPQPTGAFVDNFNRADNAALGNGWIEKSSGAFALVGGSVSKQTVSSGYLDNVVYRPASENTLDQEAAIELRMRSTNIGYPQIFTRLQPGTVANSGAVEGYILYVDGSSTQAVLGRQNGSSGVTLATFNFTQPLNSTDTFRLRLSTTGTTTVQLNAYVERLGTGGWQIIGSTSYADTSASRIATAGAVGFGGYVENTYTYDNFTRN